MLDGADLTKSLGRIWVGSRLAEPVSEKKSIIQKEARELKVEYG